MIDSKWFLDTLENKIAMTKRERYPKINELISYLNSFKILQYITLPPSALLLNVRESGKEEVALLMKWGEKGANEFFELVRYNQIITPTLSLCINGFHSFISELLITDYNGAARTLRYILETAVEACEFQTDEKLATFGTLVEEFNKLMSLSYVERNFHKLLTKHNAWVSFTEQYKIFEKTKRIAPSFKELIKRLNSRQLFQEVPRIREELKVIYEILSDFVHPDSYKFERVLDEHPDFSPGFDPETFDTVFDLGLRMLDCIQFLYIKSEALFFDFKSAEDYVGTFRMLVAIEAESDVSSFLRLPFSSALSRKLSNTFQNKERQ